MSVRQIWRRITSSRYTRALETENARLREENRALLNSILGIAGVPPIPVTEPLPGGQHTTRIPANVAPSHAAPTRHATKSISDVKPAAPNTRRRSWHQINRMLELESQKKVIGE